MTSIFDVIAVVTALILSCAVSETNEMPAPVMTSSTHLHEDDTVLYRDMELRTHILAHMTKELVTNFACWPLTSQFQLPFAKFTNIRGDIVVNFYDDSDLRTVHGCRFSSYFDIIEDAGACMPNSSVVGMKTLLETVHTCNSTVVQSTTAKVLSKMVRILLSLETKKDIYSDRIVFLRDLTTETSSAYVAITGNQTIPEVAFGMVCQGSGTWTEVLSILNEFKSMFDLMNALFKSH